MCGCRNYVVQFILELKMPSATTKLVSQFDGNYVHLSTQKFSSHVVEKCLLVCNKEVQSKIIHELLSATHFEQLLQDPHANYVIQTALKVSEVREFKILKYLRFFLDFSNENIVLSGSILSKSCIMMHSNACLA